MQRVRLLGLALMAVFALGVVAAATASAAEKEAGLLYLAGESGAVKLEGTGKLGTLTSPAGKIECTAVSATATSTQTEKHITTGSTSLTFTGCKETKGETKVACKTGEAAETILVSGTFTFFNALNAAKTELEPGLGVTVPLLKIKCGAVSIVEVKGTVLGLLIVTSLTTDVSAGTAHFIPGGEVCDLEDKFCKENTQGTKNELLANFSGTFEKATEEIEVPLTSNKMVLVDD